MKSVITKNDNAWNMFADYFDLCKAIWNAKDTDAYYETAIQKSEEFHQKYQNVTLEKDGFDELFVRKLALNAMELTERKGIEARKEAEAAIDMEDEMDLGA